MFVQNHMTSTPITVLPDQSVEQVFLLMREKNVHQLPVVDLNQKLLGMITDRDVRSAIGYDKGRHLQLKVEEVMTADPVCISSSATLEEAVALLCRHRFGALPVMHGDHLVGIITRSDLLKAFHDLLGMGEAGGRIEVAIPRGASDIVHAMEALNSDDELTSVIAARLRSDGSEPVLYIRTRHQNTWSIEKRLRARGAIILAPEPSPATG